MDDRIPGVETQRANENVTPITRISDAPAIVKARDPTAKRNLIKDTCTHRRITRNNTPGTVTAIHCVTTTIILPDETPAPATRRSTRVGNKEGPVTVNPPLRRLGGGTRASARLISQQALEAITMQEALTPPQIFTPQESLSR